MSTSLIYHGFGAIGYTYLKSEYRRGRYIFILRRSPSINTVLIVSQEMSVRRGVLSER